MPGWMAHLLTHIMVWCGSKLFCYVLVVRDETGEYVEKIAFTNDEKDVKRIETQ